ncbi:hypothetical protein ZWY2020_041109 [Hordeum vulgare]|nr:hypothetical protein ZWY2020_041109 [Hordeum vulgare]
MAAEVLRYVQAALADEAGCADAHAAALATLCDALAFTHPDVLLAAVDVAYFAARLPAFLAGGQNDLPVFAARAIAEAVDILPQWAAVFLQHGAVEALRDRLLAADNIELAEECLRALDEISQECPDECLRLGVAAAALHLFDFLSASKQKMALKIVTQLVQECDDADVPKAMEAAPALCNLLQSSDNSILGSALSCLGMLAADAHGKAEHMDRLCESKVVDTAMGLLDKDGWKTLDDDTLPGILALLKHIASVSEKAVNSLFDLGVCDLLKQMITCYSCSPSGSDKLEMLVELLYQLMQPLGTFGQMNDTTEQNAHVDQLASIVTLITQVAKCGALSSVCYRCVVVIGNIVELSTPTFLVGLQKTANLSSFLTCMLARKNRHIVFQTLEVSKTLLKKHHQFFFESFTKEGVKHAIGTIQAQEKNRNSSERLKRKNNTQEWCMCFDLDLDSSSTDGCKIENNAILNLAEEIKKSFVVVKANKKSPHRFGCVIKFVRDFFARLNRHALTVLTQDPDLCKELSDISRKFLSDELPSTSTFAFAKSGSAKYLVDYLSNRAYLKSNLNNCEDLTEQLKEVQHRLQKFTHLALKVSNGSSVKPLGILVDKLLDALHMSYESFPVILSDHGQRTRESTMIPLRHSRTQESESLDIKFVKARREKVLRSYGGVLPVSLSSKPGEMEAILWPVICSKGNAQGSSRLMFSYKGTKLQPSATIFESLVRLMNAGQSDIVIDSSFWDEEYRISYNRNKSENIPSTSSCNTRLFAVQEKLEQSIVKDPFFCSLFLGKLPGDVDESDPSYDLLFTLKVLEGLNRFSYQLSMDQQICKFAEGYLQNLDDLKVTISPIPQHQFMSNLLTNKLELQMQERLFEDGWYPCGVARWKYFCLTVHRSFMGDETSIPDGSSTPDEESAAPDEEEEESDAQNEASKKTRKHKVTRDNILESAASMMTKHGSSTKTIEVVFVGEVGTGRGPTFEFYSTVSHELQRLGIGMWRGDNNARKAGEAGFVRSSFGLFPQPWSSVGTSTRGIELSDVELDIYDIPSFDPELGKTVLEFQALVKRKKFLEKSSEKTPNRNADLSYKNVRLEDLCLDFTLPGNPDYELVPGGSEKMVTLENLEEYVNLIVDATLKSGIAKQVEAFKSAVNEVFALKTLRMFDEEEMERILCGEQDSWASSKLEDHIEFEHGYDASSPPIKSVTHHLPLFGLSSLDPKLTVFRKQCDGNIDNELPSVNTCRHFIKLPPYSSKEIMLTKLKYALAEGLGSFHLS